jgi:hypothetical protein
MNLPKPLFSKKFGPEHVVVVSKVDQSFMVRSNGHALYLSEEVVMRNAKMTGNL